MHEQKITLNVPQETLNLPNFNDFVAVLQTAAEELTDKIPLDASLTVDVDRVSSGYEVAIRMFSQAINLSETSSGHSPFVALEKVIMKANETLHLWVMKRNV